MRRNRYWLCCKKMRRQITVLDLYDSLRERLGLRLVSGKRGLDRVIYDPETQIRHTIVAGPLNYIHPTPVQIIGPTEKEYLSTLDPREHLQALDRLCSTKPAAIILTDRIPATRSLSGKTKASRIPLFTSTTRDNIVLDNLLHYAARFLAQKATLHGVFLEVLGMGVLLTGHSAVGKSELALDLITRGSRLVADDAPEFTRIAPDIISGTCPPLLRDFLEVRGLGILNIRAMFGDSAIKRTKYLRLIVHLKRMSADQISGMDRLSGAHSNRDVLGVSVSQVTVPVAPGRNLAVLVESAVRNHLLRLKGYDATEVLIERQQQAILDQQKPEPVKPRSTS